MCKTTYWPILVIVCLFGKLTSRSKIHAQKNQNERYMIGEVILVHLYLSGSSQDIDVRKACIQAGPV